MPEQDIQDFEANDVPDVAPLDLSREDNSLASRVSFIESILNV